MTTIDEIERLRAERRERIAMAVLSGMDWRQFDMTQDDYDRLVIVENVSHSVRIADALIAELDKDATP